MDDDNDFQSQNLQLVGEGSNKLQPVLQPYSIPKFDFDDNLHGNIRFDSLVESEVLLGIESHEDNQWIDEFSRSSSRIRFSSGAEETCSIPRHNNVWSEVASSESVEMLLNSVGQEEVVPDSNNPKEPDPCDELGSVIKHMKTSLKQDDDASSSAEGATDLGSTVRGEIPENFDVLDTDNGKQTPQVENTSHTDKGDATIAGFADLTAVTGKAMEGNSSARREYHNNQLEGGTLGGASLGDRTLESSSLGSQLDRVVASAQNIITANVRLSTEDAPDHVNDAMNANQVKQHPNSKVTSIDPDSDANEYASNAHLENPLCLSSVEAAKEEDASETKLNKMDESRLKAKEVSDLSEDLKIEDQSKVNKDEASVIINKDLTNDGMHEVEDSNVPLSDNANLVVESGATLSLARESEASKDEADASSDTSAGNSVEVGEKGQEDIHGCNLGAHVDEKDGTEFPSDCSNVNCVVAESFVVDRGHGTDSLETELVVPKLQSDAAAGNESAAEVTGKSAKMVTCDKVDGVLPGDGITSDVVVDHRDTEMLSIDMVKSMHSDKQEEITNKTSVALLELNASTVSESEKGISSAAADQTPSTADAHYTECQSESHAAVIKSVSQNCMREVEVSPPLCDSNANRDNVALVKKIDEKLSLNLLEQTLSSNGGDFQFISGESQGDTNPKSQKDDETAIPFGDISNRQVAVSSGNEFGSSAAIDELESGSPTVIKTTEISPNGNDKGAEKFPEHTLSVPGIAGAGVGTDAGKNLSVPCSAKQHDALKDDKSFTFEVTPLKNLPQNEACDNWQPFSLGSSKQSPVSEASQSISDSSQLDPKIAQGLSCASPKVPDLAIVQRGSKGNPERKTRRGSGKATGKESVKKRNPVKETTPVRLDRGEKKTNVPLSPGITPVKQASEMQHYRLVDSTGLKSFSLATSTSSLPDLNSSASLSAWFQQPFTDLQQLQLRAQIFVYGALIQGTAPDEACMVSAFGGPDGGRGIWKNAWRSCLERLHGKRSHLITPETPVQSCSGAKPDQVVKQGTLQGKTITSPVVLASSKPTPIVSPMVPFSSPLWSLPTPSGDTLPPSGVPRGPLTEYNRPLSPLHPHQTPPKRNYVGHNPSSFMAQTPIDGPWGASHTTALDATGHFPMQLPLTEYRLTPSKEPSSLHSSGAKHVPTDLVALSGASASVVTVTTLASDPKKVSASSSQPPAEPKPRKRKKTLVSKSSAQSTLHPQPQIGPTHAPAVTANPSTAAAVMSLVGFASKEPEESISSDLRKRDQIAEQRATLSEETLGKLKEARMLAGDATYLAATAVSHSQEIWSQLDQLKNSGIVPDIETKLASAAVAIEAAVAVAKAAAAAANVASNAALQAKLMADEAVVSSGYSCPGNVASHSDGVRNLGQASPASVLKVDNSSFISAAMDAARKKVDAASAAAKRAENVDAIVRAAELAADAVSQAGNLVTELVAAGSEGYQKSTQVTSGLVSKKIHVGRENPDDKNVGKGPDSSFRQSKEGSLGKRKTQIGNHGKTAAATEISFEENMGLVDDLSGPVIGVAKDAKERKGLKSSDLAKSTGVVFESENGSRSSDAAPNEYDKVAESSKESDIKEASHVEVFKDGSGFKAAWFSANVLSLKDGKAYVCYNDLAFGEGLEKLKEWVELKGEGGKAPKIRVARPVTAMPFDGTRKRRRAAIGDYSWSVGDRVDAWIQDSWWEGVITEKNKKDESMLTVHFPVQEETTVVRAWHLRSSLVWEDGKWIEWSSSRGRNSSSLGGDTPQEKRQRVQSPVMETKGKDKTSEVTDAVESDETSEPTLLELSADEKLFNIGKSSRNESKPDCSLRMTRTGLQKEGSRVIFGVPKPGKKRKFMEVSKHYVAGGSSKTNATNESIKLTKCLMPQGSGSRGWKNTSKTVSNEKRAALMKPKVLRSGKPQNVSGRTILQKENVKTTAASASDNGIDTDNTEKSKESVRRVEDLTGKHKLMGFQSFSGSEGAAEGPIIFSSLLPPSESLSSKKISAGNSKPERISKGKLAPAGGKLGKIEEEKIFNCGSVKSASDVVEPRRSNRRIQPTSRLLEGLQSSLMVTKIPSVSHDKSQKSRSIARG